MGRIRSTVKLERTKWFCFDVLKIKFHMQNKIRGWDLESNAKRSVSCVITMQKEMALWGRPTTAAELDQFSFGITHGNTSKWNFDEFTRSLVAPQREYLTNSSFDATVGLYFGLTKALSLEKFSVFDFCTTYLNFIYRRFKCFIIKIIISWILDGSNKNTQIKNVRCFWN